MISYVIVILAHAAISKMSIQQTEAQNLQNTN